MEVMRPVGDGTVTGVAGGNAVPLTTTRKAEQRFRNLFCATLVTAGLLLNFGLFFFVGPGNKSAAFRRPGGLGDTGSPAAAAARVAKWNIEGSTPRKRLAVVVPTHRGDFSKALASLAKWPTRCSPITQANVDLILYKAEAQDAASTAALSVLEDTPGRCFANTKIVFGSLTEEVRVLCKCTRYLSPCPPLSLRLSHLSASLGFTYFVDR